MVILGLGLIRGGGGFSRGGGQFEDLRYADIDMF